MKKHALTFFDEVSKVSSLIDTNKIDDFATKLNQLRKRNGRLFFLGVGGGAGNCSHAVNDFRKLCNIESYCITDNVSELTARTNDEGWNTSFSEWLKISKLSKNDAIFILSVGGGDIKKKVSVNIVNAARYAKKKGSNIVILNGVKFDAGYKGTQKGSEYTINLLRFPKSALFDSKLGISTFTRYDDLNDFVTKKPSGDA